MVATTSLPACSGRGRADLDVSAGQSAAFVEADGELILLVNTDPLTACRINRETPAEDPWTYLGALRAESLLREAVTTSKYAWFVGDMGAFAVPICRDLTDELEPCDLFRRV